MLKMTVDRMLWMELVPTQSGACELTVVLLLHHVSNVHVTGITHVSHDRDYKRCEQEYEMAHDRTAQAMRNTQVAA